MTLKYHINNDGVPAPCKAKPGNCPFGGSESHFDNIEDAQTMANEILEEEYGYLPKEETRKEVGYMKSLSGKKVVSFRKATTDRDFEMIDKRVSELSKPEGDGQVQYIDRCLHSKRDDNYFPSNETTKHFKRDRKKRRDILNEEFDNGEVVGYYDVKQYNPKYKKAVRQFIEIRESGRMTVYNLEGRAITTFIATPSRIESIMIKAGDRPSNEFLDVVKNSRSKMRRL